MTDQPDVAQPDSKPEHRCAPPSDILPGQQWICPGCQRTWGQSFTPPVAADVVDNETPQQEIVNVGALLRDMSDALVETGHAFVPGVPSREAQAAFYRLGGMFARASKVFGQVAIALPLEQRHG
jgi:hypothetical protein